MPVLQFVEWSLVFLYLKCLIQILELYSTLHSLQDPYLVPMHVSLQGKWRQLDFQPRVHHRQIVFTSLNVPRKMTLYQGKPVII